MPTKKVTQKKARRASRPQTLRKLAEKIVADHKHYDADTRDAIKYALTNNSKDLSELVSRAEAGETILDVTIYDRKCRQSARTLLDFLNSGVPDFITDAAMSALERGAARRGFELPTFDPDEPKTVAVERLAQFIASTPPAFTLRRADDSLDSLAEHLSAVIKHPLTPALLYHDITNRMTDFSSCIDFDAPEMIARAIESYDETADLKSRALRKGDLR
jgi:hypothetical protein